MFTEDQWAHLSSVKGPKDEAGVGSFRDRLQEDGHPLWPLFARTHEWHKQNPEATALPWSSPNPISGDARYLPASGHPNYEKELGPSRKHIFWRVPLPKTYPGSHSNLSVETGHIPVGNGKYSRGAKLEVFGHRFSAPLRKEELADLVAYLEKHKERKVRQRPVPGRTPFTEGQNVVEPEQAARPPFLFFRISKV